MAGSMVRASVFPFDRCLNNAIEHCENHISMIIGIIMTLLPFFFMASVVLPLFQRELNEHMHLIAAIALSSMLVCAIRLFIDKKVATLISTQVLMFNAMVFIWFIYPNKVLVSSVMEMIVVKALLNIAILYFGKEIISSKRTKNGFDLWMLSISLILSFGIPGIVMIRPLFTLVTAWYGIAPYVSILVTFLLAVAFLYTFINISELFSPAPRTNGRTGLFTVNNVILSMILIFCLSVSIIPHYIHELSANYHATFIGRDR